MPTADIRVTVKNGYGVPQEYSVDLWHGYSIPSTAYIVPNAGGERCKRPIRRGTKVYNRVIIAARCVAIARRGNAA